MTDERDPDLTAAATEAIIRQGVSPILQEIAATRADLALLRDEVLHTCAVLEALATLIRTNPIVPSTKDDRLWSRH
jgi:hypothetical protein